MKKIAIALLIVGSSMLVMAVAASADPPAEPPGQGDCSHGNSGQTCVPDPQPTNGQDCEEHGNEGGVNEDHCLSTPPPTTTTTVPPTTTTTPPSTTTEPPPMSTTTTATESPSTSTTTEPPTVSVTTTATVTTPPPAQGPKDPPRGEAKTGKTQKLAFTGTEDVVAYGLVALILLTLGSGLFWLGNRRANR